MKIDLIISADDVKCEKIKDKVVVVIDMLRATSVITTALANGAKRVIPLLTVEEAFEKGKELKENYLLGGERRAIHIEGFHLSNSPLDYKEEVVSGRDIILSTTNGTRAINKCLEAKRILIGCMLNGRAIAERLEKLNDDVVLVNAGTMGQFSMDDFICAGYIIHCLTESHEQELTDIATTAKYIYHNNPTVVDYIKMAKHYEVLKSLQLEKDIAYCCEKNLLNIVPQYKNGEIILT